MQENNLQGKRRKKKNRRSENSTLIGSIILCIVTLAAITICLVVVFQYRAIQLENVAVMNELDILRVEQEASYSQTEVDALISTAVDEAVEHTAQEVSQDFLDTLKQRILSGEGTTAMLRYFYPDEIVLADAGQYYFFPISENLKPHTYNLSGFSLDDDNIMTYRENGNEISHKGIDVSRYQERINWKEVAGDGVEYAIIRLGIRGYTTGEMTEDATFTYNISRALDNGIKVGVYFFTQAISEEEAREEAEFVLESIAPYDVTYPIVIDVEDVSSDNSRTAKLTKEERTQYCIAFLDTIKEAGYRPMIYGNLKSFMLMLDLEQLEDYDKWIAYYDEDIYYPYDFKIWQYTNKGRVAGIKGDVDMNISFEDLADE